MRRASRTVTARIHRLTGQLEAIETMLLKKRSCAEVLAQINAVRAGLEQVAAIVFEIELQKLSVRKRLQQKDIEKLTHAFTQVR